MELGRKNRCRSSRQCRRSIDIGEGYSLGGGGSSTYSKDCVGVVDIVDSRSVSVGFSLYERNRSVGDSVYEDVSRWSEEVRRQSLGRGVCISRCVSF